MKVLVAYDIGGMETSEGQARWRNIANICKAHGQRVQKSLFECTLNDVQLEELKHSLLDYIDMQQDSLRIYQLPRSSNLWVYGVQCNVDFEGPLVL